MKQCVQDVTEFHRVCGVHLPQIPGQPTDAGEVLLPVNLVVEEFFETLQALGDTPDCVEEHEALEFAKLATMQPLKRLSQHPANLVSLADGVIDLIVVAVRLGLSFGLPMEALWAEVQRSNMAKSVDGQVRRREDGKILKPEGWTPPDIAGVLRRAQICGHCDSFSYRVTGRVFRSGAIASTESEGSCSEPLSGAQSPAHNTPACRHWEPKKR